MAIKFAPEQGTILICDFKGLNAPEITKKRPVVVVSPRMKDRWGLCTVVPFSTTPPRPIKGYHFRITTNPPLPHPYDSEHHWIKGDMIYTVGYDRLSLPFDGTKDAQGKRVYDQRVVCAEDFAQIQICLLTSLGMRPVNKNDQE
jgi:uncharacterized protein YifN (PemK superfamily)